MCKAGQEIGNRLVQLELALVDQHHRRHAGDRLGHRIEAEQAVFIDARESPRVPTPRATTSGACVPQPSVATAPTSLPLPT
jgi:hypothetical protein